MANNSPQLSALTVTTARRSHAKLKYDFKVQQDERTFAQNLLHVAAVDYDLIGSVHLDASGAANLSFPSHSLTKAVRETGAPSPYSSLSTCSRPAVNYGDASFRSSVFPARNCFPVLLLLPDINFCPGTSSLRDHPYAYRDRPQRFPAPTPRQSPRRPKRHLAFPDQTCQGQTLVANNRCTRNISRLPCLRPLQRTAIPHHQRL